MRRTGEHRSGRLDLVKKILLVEDQAVIAMRESLLIRKHGFEVVIAYSGEKAVAAVESDPEISLILMDIDLGAGIDGTEAADRILENREVPIVFLTSHAEEEYVDRVKKITGYGYVLKSSGEFVLMESINMAYKLFESNRKTKIHECELERERNKLYALSESSPVSIIHLDRKGIISYANRQAEQTLNIDKDDILLKYFSDEKWERTDFEGNPFPDAELPFEVVKRTLRPIYDIRYAVRKKDGSRRFLSTNAVPLFDNDGVFDGIISVCNDITAQQNYEQELVRSETKYRELFENSPVGIFQTNSDGRTLRANPRMAELIGADTPEEYVSVFQDLSSQLYADPRRRMEFLDLLRRQGAVEDFEYEVIRMDGQRRWFRMDARISRCNDDGSYIIDGFVMDITPFRQAERLMLESQERYYQLLNRMKEGVAVYKPVDGGADFEFIDMNSAGLAFSGKSREEVIGRRVAEVFPGVEEAGLLDVFRQVHSTGISQVTPLKQYRDDILVQWVENRVFSLPSGHIVAVYEDTTGKRLTEERYRNVINTITDGFFLLDNEGNILDVNPAICRMSGYSKEELIGQNIAVVEAKESTAEIYAHLQRISAQGSDRFESLFRRKDGSVFPIEVSANFISGGETRIVSFIRDITERKKDREQLEHYKKVVDSSEDTIVAVDRDFRYVIANETFLRKRGLKLDTVIGEKAENILGSEIFNSILKPHLEACLNGRNINFDMPMEYPGGAKRQLHVSYFPLIEQDSIVGVGSTIKDITKTYTRYGTFLQVLNSLNSVIYVADMENYELLFMNEHAIDRFGNHEGQQCYKVLQQNMSAPCSFCRNRFLVDEKGNPNEGCVYEFHNSLAGRWYSIYDTAIYWYDGRLVRLEIATDITDVKNREQRLNQLNSEKDFLMQELNHRVKNNLLMISTLISLKDPEAKNTDLNDIRRQIDAVRIVHERLHQVEDITRLNLHDYIQDLLTTIFSSFTKQAVLVENTIVEILVETSSAISIGLIVNELASNAIKHGFLPHEEARFMVGMDVEDGGDCLVLKVSNTGVPFPDEIDLDQPDSLGLRLLTLLTAQLNGTVQLRRHPFPRFTIRIPREKN